MSSIGTTLLNSLRSVERPGDFCVGGIREIFTPTIDVDGVAGSPFRSCLSRPSGSSQSPMQPPMDGARRR